MERAGAAVLALPEGLAVVRIAGCVGHVTVLGPVHGKLDHLHHAWGDRQYQQQCDPASFQRFARLAGGSSMVKAAIVTWGSEGS